MNRISSNQRSSKKSKGTNPWIYLVPLIFVLFITYPSIKSSYDQQNKQQEELREKEERLELLKNKKDITLKEKNEITRLEIQVKAGKQAVDVHFYSNLKLLGVIGFLVVLFGAMFTNSYISNKKKNDPNNRVINFTYEDPFQDAIGSTVSWDPCANGGSNFRSERYVKTRFGYKVDSTFFVKIFAWAFLLIGIAWTGFSFFKAIKQGKEIGVMEIGHLFFTSGGMFIIVGVGLIFMFGAKVFIFKSKRIVVVDGEKLPFNQIYALQVLQKIVYSKHSYPCYEVNLVTKTGERYNLLNHGDKDYILSDMAKISQLFKVPVWNMGVE